MYSLCTVTQGSRPSWKLLEIVIHFVQCCLAAEKLQTKHPMHCRPPAYPLLKFLSGSRETIAKRARSKNRSHIFGPPARLRQTSACSIRGRGNVGEVFLKKKCISRLFSLNMVTTKHCCWGKCTTDARYPEKLHKSLKEMLELGMKIFIPFPKPSQGIERCQRWINACCLKILPSIILTETRTSVHYTGQVREAQLANFPTP